MHKSEEENMRHDTPLRELTLRGMILGAVLTVIFTASNVYLGLKVGLTFSSAIPAAVISMAVLRKMKDANILENNMVQTQASAAGTLSAIIFIIPGMLMIGYWQDFEFWQTLIVAACGGALGVLFTIPLRRAMVVHSNLPYPEGVAAAEILKVGSGKGMPGGLKEITLGGIVSGAISLFTGGFHFLASEAAAWFPVGAAASQMSLGFSSALIGAGYLVGITAGLSMLFGILLAWLVFVPYYAAAPGVVDFAALKELALAAYSEKVRLVGAGAMGVAAVWTLIMLAKPVIDGVKESLAAVKKSKDDGGLHRMDIDMSMASVATVFIAVTLGLFAVFISFLQASPLGVAQTVIFAVIGVLTAVLTGFFVAAACAYMAGLIGTSSSPISGIGILGIIISSLIVMALCNFFGIFDLPEGEKFATATAIFITAIILSIACISNDNMQDLKTGRLVGATPWKQQVALLLGCAVGAFVIAPVLNLLYQAYGFPGALPRADMNPDLALAAPQASLMTMIAQGIFSAQMAWEYIFIGMGVGVALVIADALLKRFTKNCALPPLAVGMGIYLPPSVQTPLVVGAIMGYFINGQLKKRAKEDKEQAHQRGTLFASGLIVGESILGVLLAALIVVSVTNGGSDDPLNLVGEEFAAGGMPESLGLLSFLAVVAGFVKITLGKR